MSSTERHHGADLAKWLGLVQIELPRIRPVGKWAYVVHPAHYQALGFLRPILGG